MKRSLRPLAMVIALGMLATAGVATARQPSPRIEGEGAGMKPIANIPWKGGTDMEIVNIKGRDIAFAASAASLADGGGLHIIDVTVPEKSKEVAHLPCTVDQGDVQVSHDKKLVFMAADSAGSAESCLAVGKEGFLIVDISNYKKPKAVGFAETGSSHNVTAHPSKPYVYNSSSALVPPGKIQIWSVKNPAKPELVNTIDSLPHAPHDISFNKKGDRAVTAAISHFDLFDTSDPENPTLLFASQCPGCSITHDAKFTPDGKHIFIGDEGGGGAPYPCPGGALYAYQLNGDIPILTGIFEPAVVASAQGGVGGCTSHVFDISDDSKKLAIAWYTAGVYYLDISNPMGVTVGENGQGMKQLAWFIPAGGNTWSAKLHKGPYMFGNDRNLGFIAYKIGK
ncbi:MAG: hypothetical protein M3345_00925 [Actinomycetota bacterium]|nr:hypothetical protein [Actinomycetota bacterium]